MNLYEQQGNRSAALCPYQECARLLADELAIEPEAATTQLYLRVRDGRPSSPSPPLPLISSAPHLLRPSAPLPLHPFPQQNARMSKRPRKPAATWATCTNIRAKEAAPYLPLFFVSLDAFKKVKDQRGLRLVLLNIGHACLKIAWHMNRG